MLIWVNQCGETKGEQRIGKLPVLQYNFQPCPELALLLDLLLCAWNKAQTTPQPPPSLLHLSLQLCAHLCQARGELQKSPWLLGCPCCLFPTQICGRVGVFVFSWAWTHAYILALAAHHSGSFQGTRLILATPPVCLESGIRLQLHF